MASDNETSLQSANQAFIAHLEKTGFFQQIGNLETSLKAIVGEIQAFSETSTKRQVESENIAAHILAMESILMAVLKKYPLDEQDVTNEIVKQAETLSENGKPNPTVEAIAIDLLRKSQDV